MSNVTFQREDSGLLLVLVNGQESGIYITGLARQGWAIMGEGSGVYDRLDQAKRAAKEIIERRSR